LGNAGGNHEEYKLCYRQGFVRLAFLTIIVYNAKSKEKEVVSL
jgi:hypothetical protein